MAVLQGGVYTAELVSDVDLTGAAVACQSIAPDGTVSAETVNVAGTAATAVITATQVGTWLLVWSTTGAVVGTTQDQFSCEPARADLLSLPDLKEELQLKPTNTDKDSKLRRWLRAATDVAENVMGPVVPRAQIDWFDGGRPFVVLSASRASAIGSVTEISGGSPLVLLEQAYGASQTPAGYTWDRDANIVHRAGNRTAFAGGTRAVQVVYTAGMATIPDDIQLGAAELIRHWYRKNEVSSRAPSQYGGGDDTVMVGNYMVPNAVMELWEPWRRPPAIA